MIRDRADYIVPFVREYTVERGYPPTVREIARGAGYRSTSVVHWHVERLVRAGKLVYERGRARTIREPRGRAVRVLDIEEVVAGRS